MGDVVTVQEVSKTYRLGKLSVTALAGVSLRVAVGEFLAVAGPSGSGKTTLLNLIGCLDTPSAGEIAIDGEPVTRLSPGRRADLRARKLGFVFQTFNLIPVLTAWENVEYPLLHPPAWRRRGRPGQAGAGAGRPGGPCPASSRRAVGRPAAAGRDRAGAGGEPALVLADEPTANLDSQTGHEIVELMRSLNRERGTTFVFSTHDPRIMKAADRVLSMSDGRLHPAA